MRMRLMTAVLGAAAALVVVACGSASTPSEARAPSEPNLSIGQASVKVSGTNETVLTDPDGSTLYYLTSDTVSKPACTGTCLTLWPPVVSSGRVTSKPHLSGSLVVVTNLGVARPQVAYNRHLLYRYAGDSARGQARGEGIASFGGTWYVATPNLLIGPGRSPSPTPTGVSGGQ